MYLTRNGSITTDSMYWPIKQCLKIRIEIQVIWQCLSLSFEETWEINIAKKEFSNTVLWVWMVLAWFCRKNEDLASSCLLRFFANWKKEEVQHKYWFFWCLTFFQETIFSCMRSKSTFISVMTFWKELRFNLIQTHLCMWFNRGFSLDKSNVWFWCYL